MNAVGINVSKGQRMIAVVRCFRRFATSCDRSRVSPAASARHTASELRELAHSLKSPGCETRP
jgi:hypothetical protein